MTPIPAGTVITYAYPSLNKTLPVATLHSNFLYEDNSEPIPSILKVDEEKQSASVPKMTSEGSPEAESRPLGH